MKKYCIEFDVAVRGKVVIQATSREMAENFFNSAQGTYVFTALMDNEAKLELKSMKASIVIDDEEEPNN